MCENPIEHIKFVSIILLKALASKFIKIEHIFPFFYSFLMYEIPKYLILITITI